uniref:FHA domain-containing protein n=1 Tax=Globodera pallida TaxID=36090 RepID=A0A183BKA4_GLOPA
MSEDREKRKRRRERDEEEKEKPSFVPSGKLAKDPPRSSDSSHRRRRDDDEERRSGGREWREQHHRKFVRREPPPGGWDKPKWEVKTEEGEGERPDDDRKTNKEQEEEMEKPSFVPSGKLAKDTNTYKGVLIKYNEPPEAKIPKLRWRMYPFKDEEHLPVFYVHRQSAYLIGRDRKIADFPVDHPSCSKQHAALQYRSLPYERADGSNGRRTRPYLIDLGSGNGTFLNGDRIESQRYYELKEKDVLRFGFSSREYVMLHEQSVGAADAGSEDTSADEDEKGDMIDRTGGEERMAAAEEDHIF